QLISERAGIVEAPWCGDSECGQQIEEAVDARILGVPEEAQTKPGGSCILCGKPAKTIIRIALTY
ncbi:proline--tRNA ligase, partial [Candidatus Bathyarchaeota archaeon]